MMLMKDKKADVVFINPNLTLEGEGLGIADEIKLKFDCEILFFQIIWTLLYRSGSRQSIFISL
jgi:hypothetical protein